jgi:hypothetical protein
LKHKEQPVPATLAESNLVTVTKLAQIWAIEQNDRGLLPPLDDDGCESFIAFPTREDAERCLESQLSKGYIDDDCNPRVVRVK